MCLSLCVFFVYLCRLSFGTLGANPSISFLDVVTCVKLLRPRNLNIRRRSECKAKPKTE